MRILGLSLALSLVFYASHAHAQDTCNLSMTASECHAAVTKALADAGTEIIQDAPAEIEAKKETIASSSEDALRLFNTGVASALSDGGVSTIEDFVPKFKVFATGGGADEDAESILFELNNILGLPIDDGYKFTAALKRPAVFDPLLQTVAEDMRANEKDTLEKRLTDFDDLRLSFVYSPMTEKLGRSNHQLHAAIFTDLFASAEEHAGEFATDRENALNSAAGDLDAAIGDIDAGQLRNWASASRGFCGAEFARPDVLANATGFEFDLLTGDQLLCMVLASNTTLSAQLPAATTKEQLHAVNAASTAIVQNYLNAVAEAHREEYTNLSTLSASLNEIGFFGFEELINNQPQLIFSAIFNSRHELVGQDEFNLKVSYERGFVNVNSFRNHATRECGADALYLCLEEYLTAARKKQLEKGDRVSFNLEYSRKQSYNAVLASGAGMLSLPTEDSFKSSLAYGRYLSFLDSGAGNSRVELSASYEDVDGDSMRQDRFFGTVTYSQRLSNTAAVSFSVVYANKPEFRGDVGTEVSARLGLNYKMFAPKDF